MGVLDLKEISKSARELKDGLKKGISNDVKSYKRYQENKTDKRTLKQKFLDLVHKCFVKALRAKKLGAPLGFILSCVCLLAVLACIYTIIFFKHMPPGAISYLIVFVPLSLVGSYYSIGLLMSEVSELKWYCDNCSSSMDETYEILSKDVKTYVPTHTVVTGSHYELSTNKEGTLIAKEVVEKDSYQGIPEYTYSGDVKVTSTCKCCGRQQELTRRYMIKSKDANLVFDDKVIRSAIFR